MRWNRLFEDLEDQLASEQEAERAALESEAERLRVSALAVRERLIGLSAPEAADAQPTAALAFELIDGAILRGVVDAVGADFVAVRIAESVDAVGLIRLEALASIGLTERAMLDSAHAERRAPRSPLADRMTWGFVLRDVARRREPVHIALTGGRALTGTIDRVGADHLDLALHDAGAPRRGSEVTGFRMLPFHAVSWVRLSGAPGYVR